MLIILLARHSNSDCEECLSYVGTEGTANILAATLLLRCEALDWGPRSTGQITC
jgi:hypothetical protein